MSTQDWRDGYAKGKETGLELGRGQIYKQLISLGVIQPSNLGENWVIIHTDKGPTDIPKKRMLNNE
jgi:hypothetical protein